METQILIAVTVIAAACIALVRWRTGARYGAITPNGDATRAYEDFRVDPELRYYISGSDVYPNAVIGIDKTWILKSDLWKEKYLSAHEMKELVQNMQRKTWEQNIMLHGFAILDTKGRKIGNGFSVTGLSMVVEVAGEKNVIVHPPPIDTFRQC